MTDSTSRPSETSLRVGLFSESFHPIQNGVTTSVLTLINGLRQQKHHVCVFAPAHQQQREPEPNVLRFPSFVSAFNRDYPLAYPFLPRLALENHFQRLRFDVVHTHTPFVLGLTGANLAIRHSVPLVSTFHTLYHQYRHYIPLLPGTVTQGLLEYYLPWYYNRCTAIICPSRTAAKALRDLGVETAIEIIPTGIPLPPPEAVSPEACQKMREKHRIAPETPLILYAGRLSREKRPEWLLDVLARVRQDIPDAVMLIAGGGPCAEELREYANALQLGDSARFLGPTPRQELDTLYATADVFCFPSPSETQGLVIGEARAAGTPCVVVDAGGAPETVADTEDGFCVPPDDLELFAGRVAQVLQDSSLRAYLRTNALRNARKFTPEVMVRRVVEVYERARSQDIPPGEIREIEWDWEALSQSLAEDRSASLPKICSS